MACSSCGKRAHSRSVQPGASVLMPIIIGDGGGNTYKVLLSDDNVVPGFDEGQYVFVSGTGVQAAADDGLLTIVSESEQVTSGARLYCVETVSGKKCYASISAARPVAIASGSKITIERV